MAKKKPEAPAIIEQIVPSTLDDLMGERFDIYAKDVIQDRAIPDARDGMKPVQRRIIYAMYKAGNTIDKPTKKCAHIVGDVMGKYHPHGDSSIYEALVRMSQTWNVRLPLIDFQGNNGSMDGDGPAAYRYTEARLAAVSQQLIADLDKDTVDMGLTFDDVEYEPTVLPSRFPNLFVNGAQGIAVGMATDIPTHNLREIIQAVIYRIQHPSCPIESLMRFVPGPDFPTGGIIYQSQGLADIYLTGRGRIDIASRTEIGQSEDGTNQIIITEIPYQVRKQGLIFAIDKIRHEKTIAGITEVRDETDKSGLRIVVDIKDGFKPESILAYLMSKTELRSTYNANMVAIVDGRPVTLNLLSYCDTYIAHQRSVITRRSRYDLSRALARLEIVEGLVRAGAIIDEIVRVIKASKDKADSKVNLQKEFGFTESQSEAIVMMPLYKISHFDVAVVLDEKAALDKEIAELRSILADPEKLDGIIVSDLRDIAKKYGDDRRTSIEEEDVSLRTFKKRDLVARETVVVTVTRDGYVKRSSLASWRSSGGQTGALPGLKDGDALIYNGQCDTTDWMIIFTSKGNYLYIPVHLLKALKWLEEGIHVNYAVNIPPDEKMVRAFAVRSFREDLNFVIASKKGQIKRTKLSVFPVSRFNHPIRAMKMLGGDEVVSVVLTSGNSNLLVASESGLAVLYNENEISLSGTSSSGVKAASFKGSPVADVLAFLPEEKGKVILMTDLAHTRVFTMNNISLTGRLNKATVLFECFKSEPHHLLFMDKALDREAPIRYLTVLTDGSQKEIEIPDLYVTPLDKHAKKTLALPKGASVLAVMRQDNLLIDETITALPSPVSEEPASEENPVPAIEAEEGPKTVSLFEEGEENENKPAEKFEQISIFGDDDF